MRCCERQTPRQWFNRELWFTGLARKHFVCGIGELRWPFAALKFVLTAYWLAMWIFRMWEFDQINADNVREYPDYLTNWNDTIVFMYLFLSSGTILLNINGQRLTEEAPWYYYSVQVLFELAAPTSVLVSAIYWTLLASGTNYSAGNVHAHIMNVVVINLDFFLNAIPFRVLHVVYLWVFAWLYVLATYIAAKIDPARDRVYNFLDWTNGKADDWFLSSAATCAMFTFGAFTVIFYIYYGLYCLKIFIKRQFGRMGRYKVDPDHTGPSVL